ncbi:hypothetical protein PR001_g10942 [Phytophthora rubi]|uniref:Uncharacterized protein n=1 Tax=Phytophthora rubi TaxID=129364 RepID=A0A6A3MQZ4_9STRA|nr:hypothetical protein PR001_g10942 [Phytophthora rubi]
MQGCDAAGNTRVRWLQALKTGLDTDADSSDATPKSATQIPERADMERREEKPLERKAKGNVSGGAGTGRHDGDRSARLRPQEVHDATGALETHNRRKQRLVLGREPHPAKERTNPAAVGGDAHNEAARKRPEEKAGKVVQRKRPRVEVLATEKANNALPTKPEPPVDPATAKAAAVRQRRMRKLRARRKATGEFDRLVAVKSKRHDSSEASRLQRNLRDQMRRKRSSAVGADVQVGDGVKRQAQPPSLTTEEAKVRKRLLERQRRAAVKAKKERSTAANILPPTPRRKDPATALCDTEKRRRQRDEVLHLLGAKRRVVHGDNAVPDRKRRRIPHEGEGAPANRTNKTDESVVGIGLSPNGCKIDVKADEADHGHQNDLSTNCPLPEIEQQLALKEEPRSDTVVEADAMEEGQVSPPILDEPVKMPDTSTEQIDTLDNDVLLDMMPIPRKSTGGNHAATSAAPFVIPKRSANNYAERVETNLVPHANGDGKQLERVDAEVKPVSSLLASPELSNRDPIRTQRKRTKSVVPVKASTFSAQDQTLMRLARKRNSILFAVAEIEAEALLKTSTNAHLVGYEVYDGDGKILPDLIPRLSCATKREMASNKDSCTASFFGVSLCAPMAEGEADAAVNENNADAGRKINCYEELRFERPEDREFYQRRMYGTTFVPQHLRGWTTLIIRRVRFERKSTGIRFNQERDREEFAASLSKRYTFNTSVPRCNIPRDNWLKLMKTQPSTAYLHYRNREDAERASHNFRDDFGNPLEMKLEYKAGVVISRSSSPAVGGRYSETSRRSNSSEREQSPHLSRSDSSRTNPRWQQQHQSTNSDYPFSRYESKPPAHRTGEGGQYGSPINEDARSRAHLRSRSRSRSNSCPKADQTCNSVASDTGTGAQARAASSLPETVNETGENGKEMASTGSCGSAHVSENDGSGDINSQARAASPTAPPSLPTGTTGNTSTAESESDEEEKEEGEIDSSTVPMTNATCHEERDRRWSPRHWQQAPREQEEYYAASREPAQGYHPYEQQYNRDPDRRQYNRGSDRRRSRSRSQPRDTWCELGRGGGWGDSYSNEGRHFQGSDPTGCYDDNGRGWRMRSDEMGHHGGRDYRDGGYDSRSADASYPRYY